jgi:hypothetical protein
MTSSLRILGIALTLALACSGAADPASDSGSGGAGGGGMGADGGGGRDGNAAADGGPAPDAGIADAALALDRSSDVTTADAAVAADATVAAPDGRGDGADADVCGAAVLGAACSEPGKICGSERCMQACGFCNLLRCDGGLWRRLEVPPPQQPCDASAG